MSALLEFLLTDRTECAIAEQEKEDFKRTNDDFLGLFACSRAKIVGGNLTLIYPLSNNPYFELRQFPRCASKSGIQRR